MFALDATVGPLNRQLYDQLREAILTTRFKPGSKLPPSRHFAEQLGVSRNTVLHAYEQLTAEGYAVAKEGSGTFVAAAPAGEAETPVRATPMPTRWSAYARRIANEIPAHMIQRAPAGRPRYDFRYGEPAYADLPLATWARIVGRTARGLSEKQLGYAPHAGLDELREAIAGYLVRSRGVVCGPEQVVVVQGTQEAIDLIVRLLIDPGDVAVVEEPHYRGFVRCLRAAGARICHLPVDGNGLRSDLLESIDTAKLACVTPSHQFPVGGILTLERRFAVLEWARRNAALILEDDYDGEFRYGGRPVPSLQSLDRHGGVIYVGTASKILFPSLRIGWMVLPTHLVSAFTNAKAMADCSPPTLEQKAFAEFISAGHLERHVHRVRRRLAEKRKVLLSAIDSGLGERATVVGADAGIHVLLRLTSVARGRLADLIEACRARDVGVYDAAQYYVSPPVASELLLGYSSLTETGIRTGIKRLAKAVDDIGA